MAPVEQMRHAKHERPIARAKGGTMLGARVPILLTSRAHSLRTRLASSAVALLHASARRPPAALQAT